MTQSLAHTVGRNLSQIRENITRACGRVQRNPEDVTLVAITKSVGIEEVRVLYDLGVRHFGENRLHEAEAKTDALPDDAVWHMVGHIQRRKVSGVLERFDRVDAVDRDALALALNKRAGEMGKRVPVLAEINVSGEDSKHGFATGEAMEAVAALQQMEHIDIQGLMTMAPRADDPESVRGHFTGLARLAREFGLPELSMGMSEDYVVAVEEGATQVRIGRALFRE